MIILPHQPFCKYTNCSVYTVFKPPRFGNCTVEINTNLNLIKISDIKNIYENNNYSALKILKIKLDCLIEKAEWELIDVTEHDYTLAPIVDCLKYYLAGYLSY